MDVLFELADLWCHTVNAQEYLDFFEYLLPKLCPELSDCAGLHYGDTLHHALAGGHGERAPSAPTFRITAEVQTSVERLHRIANVVTERFSDQELYQIMEEFKSHTVDGKYGSSIDQARFHEILKALGHNSSYMSSRIFEAVDRSRNGKVDLKELVRGMEWLLHPKSKERALLAFRMCDLDDSGSITKYEFTAVIQACSRAGNKAISFEKLAQAGVKQWRMFDANHDGKVSKAEFMAFMESHPELVEELFATGKAGEDSLYYQHRSRQEDYLKNVDVTGAR